MCPTYILVVLIISGATSCLAQHSTPIVNIQGLGNVQGTIGYTAWTNRTIYEFQAIPYGQAPVGALRFNAPQKIGAWGGTRDASQPGVRCPQIAEGYENVDDEDCLSLSVYSNSLDAARPVMVYIHGGWFIFGGADHHKANHLLESDVVLVVIQYRLGPLGFLSTMTSDIPGNVGILDMIMALEWVQQYVQYFGGDASQVTIFGLSAGGAAVSALLHSPLVQSRSTPLFHKAIIQSGSVFAPWAITDNPLEGTNDIVSRLGCTGVTTEQCLRTANVRSLLGAFNAHRKETIINKGYPSVAGCGIVVGGPSPLFPLHPKNYLAEASKDIPVMAGTTSEDGLFLLDELHDLQPHLLQSLNTSNALLQYIRTLHEKFGHSRLDGSLEGYAFSRNFLVRETNGMRWDDMVASLTDICGSHGIKGPVMTDVQSFALVNPGNVYLYSFDYTNGHLFRPLKVPFPHKLPVQHGEDLKYIFPMQTLSEADINIAKSVVRLWASFATRGAPSSSNVPYWPPVDGLFGPYLKINTESEQRNYYYNEFIATSEKYRVYGAGSRVMVSFGSIATVLTLCIVVNIFF